VYTVGLRSKAYRAATLADLARGAGGTYQEAGSADALRRLYVALGATLANEYLVRYRSPADPGRPVHVRVEPGVPGLVGLGGYRSPALPAPPARPVHPPVHVDHSPFASHWAPAAVGALVAMLLFGGVAFALRRRARTSGVRSRVVDFVQPLSLETQRRREIERADERRGLLASAKWWPRLEEALELAALDLNPGRFVGLVAAATALGGLVLAVLAGIPLLFLIAVVAGPLVARGLVQARIGKQRRLFAAQLADTLQQVASAMRTGHSLSAGLATVAQDSPEPMGRELRRVVADEQVGVPLEKALAEPVRRMQSDDLEQVALIAALQRETGGNGAEVLERVVDTVRGREELRRVVRTLTAQGRMSQWVLSCLPVGVLGVLLIVNKDYVAPLFDTGIGRIALVLSAVLVAAGSAWIRKVVNIKV
jgi:tight adherence protein B